MTVCVVSFTTAVSCAGNGISWLNGSSCVIEYYTKTTISTMTPKQQSKNTKLEQVQSITINKIQEQYKCKSENKCKGLDIPVFFIFKLKTCTKRCVIFDSLDLYYSTSKLNNLRAQSLLYSRCTMWSTCPSFENKTGVSVLSKIGSGPLELAVLSAIVSSCELQRGGGRRLQDPVTEWLLQGD